jgi:hypothetical protein
LLIGLDGEIVVGVHDSNRFKSWKIKERNDRFSDRESGGMNEEKTRQ